jgi:hypothetical protein
MIFSFVYASAIKATLLSFLSYCYLLLAFELEFSFLLFLLLGLESSALSSGSRPEEKPQSNLLADCLL